MIILLLINFLMCNDSKVIFKAMDDEISRSLEKLKIEDLTKPYFIEYNLKNQKNIFFEANLGSIVKKSENETNYLTTKVRVGDYTFDNTNFTDIGLSFFGSSDDEERYLNRRIVLNPSYDYLRRELWLSTDAAYKQSSEIFTKKISVLKNKIRKDTIPDFMQTPKTTNFIEKNEIKIEKQFFENLTKELSSIFNDFPEVNSSKVTIEYVIEENFYCNSEGTKYINFENYGGLEIGIITQAKDGMPLINYYTAFFKDQKNLPTKDSLIKATKKIANSLKEQLNLKAISEDYSGPIVFEAEAAAQLFAQNFAPNLISQRESLSESGFSMGANNKAFQTKIGGRVLPEFLSVELIPNLKSYQNTDLLGNIQLDDNGYEPIEINLVKDGYLKNLISERIPTKKIKTNLAHKRNGAAMYSTLELNSISDIDINSKFLELITNRELEYGIKITKIADRNILVTSIFSQYPGILKFPQGNSSFIICEAYKVYKDGKTELCRGLVGKSFTVQSFKDIIATGKNKYALNLLAQAVVSTFETGGSQYVPASVIVPDLLFEDGELNITTEDFEKPPFLNNPIK